MSQLPMFVRGLWFKRDFIYLSARLEEAECPPDSTQEIPESVNTDPALQLS